MTSTFVVQRNDLHQTGWLSTSTQPLVDGAVRLSVAAFALTSNNITCAAFGDAMNYWNFFPTGAADTGCIPVWGFGDVIESRCTGVAVGERFYGYFPMATESVSSRAARWRSERRRRRQHAVRAACLRRPR